MGTFALPAISWLKAKHFELDRLEFGFRQEGFDLAGAQGRLCVFQELQALVDDVAREGRVLVSRLRTSFFLKQRMITLPLVLLLLKV